MVTIARWFSLGELRAGGGVIGGDDMRIPLGPDGGRDIEVAGPERLNAVAHMIRPA
jgi:hypothetical protein